MLRPPHGPAMDDVDVDQSGFAETVEVALLVKQALDAEGLGYHTAA